MSGSGIVPEGKKIRYKCLCGHVDDTKEGAVCKKCGRPQEENCGYFKLYRLGNVMGFMSPFTIYIDGISYGRIGNKQTCWIRLPFGAHSISIAAGFNNRGNDLQFTLSPNHPLECGKVHIRVGAVLNSYIVEPASNEEVPD